MANWALVENNEIKELHDFLPENWRNISGLRLSQDNLGFLKSLGWFFVVKNYQTFDDGKYSVGGYKHEFSDDQVIETLSLIEKQPEYQEPLVDMVMAKQQFLIDLREKRNQLLKDSDWSQLTDVQNLMGESTKQMWIDYRQRLRDLPLSYIETEVISLDQVNWPTVEITN